MKVGPRAWVGALNIAHDLQGFAGLYSRRPVGANAFHRQGNGPAGNVFPSVTRRPVLVDVVKVTSQDVPDRPTRHSGSPAQIDTACTEGLHRIQVVRHEQQGLATPEEI